MSTFVVKDPYWIMAPHALHEEGGSYKIVSWNLGTRKDYSNICFIKHELNRVETRWKIAIAVAILALGLFLVCGLLYYFQQDLLSRVAACGGIALMLGDAVVVAVILSKWKGRAARVSKAYQELHSSGELQLGYTTTLKEQQDRTRIFQKAFRQFGNPDIMCLQGTEEMSSEDLINILPKGYTFFRNEKEEDGVEDKTTVVWNAQKFSKVGHTVDAYNTIILLEDGINGATICVANAHLPSFSLAYENIERRPKKGGVERSTKGKMRF